MELPLLTTTSESALSDTTTAPSIVSTAVLPPPTLTPKEVPRTPATPSGVSTLTGAVLAELFRWAI